VCKQRHVTGTFFQSELFSLRSWITIDNYRQTFFISISMAFWLVRKEKEKGTVHCILRTKLGHIKLLVSMHSLQLAMHRKLVFLSSHVMLSLLEMTIHFFTIYSMFNVNLSKANCLNISYTCM